MCFGGNDFLGLIISFLVFCGTLWLRLVLVAEGACSCDVLVDVFLDLIFVLWWGLGSFKSVCVLVGMMLLS